MPFTKTGISQSLGIVEIQKPREATKDTVKPVVKTEPPKQEAK